MITECINLLRINQPRGIVLLAWPTLMPFALYPSHGRLFTLMIFTIGIVIMRSLGCLINDFFDQDVDAKVLRTQYRPLAAKTISLQVTGLIAATLLLCALTLWLQLNIKTQVIAIIAFLMSMSYPLMKRLVALPQVFLGLTFSMGYLMATAELGVNLNYSILIGYLFWAYWIFAYDTLYARADYADDIHLNIHSSAVFFGNRILPITYYMYAILILLMVVLKWVFQLGSIYLLGCTACSLMLFTSLQNLDLSSRECWTNAFLRHQWIGGIYLFSILSDRLLYL